MYLKMSWLALSVALLSSCARDPNLAENAEVVLKKSTRVLQELNEKEHSNVSVHTRPWVSKKAIRAVPHKLPPSADKQVVFATAKGISCNEFSQLINRLSGLSIQFTPDALNKLVGENKSQSGPSKSSGNRNLMSKEVQEEQLINGIRWKGKLSGLLDLVAASLGLNWKYARTGAIEFYYLETKTFRIFAIPSTTAMSSIVQSGISAGISGSESGTSGTSSSSGSSDGQSTQKTEVSLKSSISEDIQKNVEAMLTPNLGRMSISSSTGSITVTDTPMVIAEIGSYLESENKTITQQILLNIKIFTVELKDENSLDIDWKLAFNQAGERATFSGSVSSQGLNILSGKFGDSSILIEALSQQGTISMVTSPTVTTLNLQAVPVQVATQTGYLAKQEISSTAQVGTSVSLTPGTVTTGFNMNLLPFILSSDTLLLQYSINLSELMELKEIKSQDNKIQLPVVDNKIFSQKVKMKSNETLVLSGFEQNRGAQNKTSKFLAGGRSRSQKKIVVVILITPVIMG